jgi:hypothetical protein
MPDFSARVGGTILIGALPWQFKLAEHVVDFSKFQCNPRRLEWFTTVNLAVEKGEFVEKQ